MNVNIHIDSSCCCCCCFTWFLASGLASAQRRTRHVSLCPFWQQRWSGVKPARLTALTLAFCWVRIVTVCEYPLQAASCNALFPCCVNSQFFDFIKTEKLISQLRRKQNQVVYTFILINKNKKNEDWKTGSVCVCLPAVKRKQNPQGSSREPHTFGKSCIIQSINQNFLLFIVIYNSSNITHAILVGWNRFYDN